MMNRRKFLKLFGLGSTATFLPAKLLADNIQSDMFGVSSGFVKDDGWATNQGTRIDGSKAKCCIPVRLDPGKTYEVSYSIRKVENGAMSKWQGERYIVNSKEILGFNRTSGIKEPSILLNMESRQLEVNEDCFIDNPVVKLSRLVK